MRFRVLVTAVCAVSAAHGAGWTFETVDTGGSAGRNSSLAFHPDGYAAIAYRTCGGTDLRYAVREAGSWSTETVDNTGNTGAHPSLAFDSSGFPHISYLNVGTGDLEYIRWNGSSWVHETVDTQGDTGWHTSLVLDSTDHPHICYYDQGNGDLKYAGWNGVSWDLETVDSAGETGLHPSLAVDGEGVLQVSYCGVRGASHALLYAVRTGSSWEIQTVDQGEASSGWFSSLAIDGNGDPHISYGEGGDPMTSLKYASWNGSSWDIQLVQTGNDTGYFSSLSLDPSDDPVISWLTGDPGLMTASWTGTGWLVEFLTETSFGETSIAHGPDGEPALSYWARGESLGYAFLTGTGVAHEGSPVIRDFFASPNPSGGEAVLCFDMDRSGPVEFTIHDVTGRQRGSIPPAVVPAGAGEVRLPVLSPGLYTIVMRTGETTSLTRYCVTGKN